MNGVSLVDVSSVEITRDTVFVALFEKVHSVQFVLDEETISSQSIENNKFAETPSSTSEYMQINYWTVDGEKVDVNTYPITKDTIFVANFTKKYDVKFMYEDFEFNKQIVLGGNTPTIVTPDNTDYKEFKGWSIDKQTIVDVATTPITEATTYYAIIEYSFDVKFMVDSTLYENQIIKTNSYPTMPTTNPTKAGFDFDGWSLDGKTIIDVTTIQITDTTEFKAVFTQLFIAKFNYENTIVDSQVIRNGEYPTTFTVEDTDRVKFQGWSLDKTNIIDVNTISITSETTFYAVVIYCYKVDFIANDTTYYSIFVENGKTAEYNGSLDVGDYEISGWTLNEKTVVLSDYTISKDTTFVASLKRVRVTFSGNFSNAYSITDNWSSAGVYIFNFQMTDFLSFDSYLNSADFVFTYGFKNSSSTYSGNSNRTVELSRDGKIGISVSMSGGGFSIYIYDKYYYDADFNIVFTPVHFDISSML